MNLPASAIWLTEALLVTRPEILADPELVPASSGVYAWWFDSLLKVPTEGTLERDGKFLLYVGVAPKNFSDENSRSPRNLRHRMRDHLKGNANDSVLRLNLGLLLGYSLSPVEGSSRLTFGEDEAHLNGWINEHARVCFLATDEHREMKARLVESLSLPLTVDQNQGHPFYSELSDLRQDARKSARSASGK